MTREDAIKRWADIAEAVFWAENRIMPVWMDTLRSAKTMAKEELDAIAEAYCEAIAEEIVSMTSDEE